MRQCIDLLRTCGGQISPASQLGALTLGREITLTHRLPSLQFRPSNDYEHGVWRRSVLVAGPQTSGAIFADSRSSSQCHQSRM